MSLLECGCLRLRNREGGEQAWFQFNNDVEMQDATTFLSWQFNTTRLSTHHVGYWYFHPSHGLLIACFTTYVDCRASRVLPHLFYASVAMAMNSTCIQSCTVQHWLLYSATMASPSTLCFSWAHTLGGWSQEVNVNKFIPIYMPDHWTTLQQYRQLILSSNVNCVP